MAAAGWAFLLVVPVVLVLAAVLLVGSGATHRRLSRWRTQRVRTTGAVSKLPMASGRHREVEVTYLGPDGRPYVLAQRRPAEPAAPAPRIALPITVLYAPGDPHTATVDDHWMGPAARVRGLRTGGLLLVLLGLMSGMVGAGLLVIAGWHG